MKKSVFLLLLITFLSMFYLCAEEKKEEVVKSEREQRIETLQFGLDSEVTALITDLITDEDASFTEDLFLIFESTRNTALKDAIIRYFTKFENDSIKDYAMYILEDPYDEHISTVRALIQYVSTLKIAEAGPLLVSLIDSDEKTFFSEAVVALGEIGGSEESLFLIEYLENDVTTGERQTIIKAIAKILDPSTYDMLVKIVEDDEENSYVRMYASEAIGKMKPEESTDILVELFTSIDPNLREYAIKGLTSNSSEKATNLILSALKDDHQKVRFQAITSIIEKNLREAGPSLLYRSKNDAEVSVKNKCYEALSALNYADGIDYMVELLDSDKVNDTVKTSIASSLLKYDVTKGIDAVIDLALKVVGDDKKKNLRYALGKEFSKYENVKFAKVCEAYLASDDVSTKGTGLDMYKTNRFVSLQQTVKTISEEDKSGIIKSKAKSLL